MKRGDIEPWNVYGYSNQRGTRIHQYAPVMIVSTVSYFRSTRGQRLVEPAQDPAERLVQGRSYQSAVGLLAVMVDSNRTDHDSVRRLRAAVTVDKALVALNSDDPHARTIYDGEDRLGSYFLMSDARHLHGYYDVLVRELEAREQRNRDIAQRHEDERLTDLARYRAITARLGDLGVMIAPANDYDSPSMVKFKFEQVERLLELAESAVRANKAAGIGI